MKNARTLRLNEEIPMKSVRLSEEERQLQVLGLQLGEGCRKFPRVKDFSEVKFQRNVLIN